MLPTQKQLHEQMKKMEKELEDQKKAKAEQATQSPLAGEKEQGQPQPPSEEKQQKRLEAGVAKKKKPTGEPTGKGMSKPMGGTRMPADVQVQETVIDTSLWSHERQTALAKFLGENEKLEREGKPVRTIQDFVNQEESE